MFQRIMNHLGYVKKRKPTYQNIQYRDPDAPENNSKALIDALVYGHRWVQERTNQEYESIGILFTAFLLIEHKLEGLLGGYDEEISDKTFGRKIDVFRDFLRDYNPSEGEDIETYRNLIAPLRRIKVIRDGMAHDISKTKPSSEEVAELDGFVRCNRPDLYRSVSSCCEDDVKNIGVVLLFGFLFAERISHLRIKVE